MLTGFSGQVFCCGRGSVVPGGGGGRTVLMGAAGPARWGAAHLFGGAWDCGMMLPGPAPAFHTPAPGGLSLAR